MEHFSNLDELKENLERLEKSATVYRTDYGGYWVGSQWPLPEDLDQDTDSLIESGTVEEWMEN